MDGPWSVATGEAARVLPHVRTIKAVEYAPWGGLLAVGSDDGRARLFDTESFEVVAELPHGARVIALAFDPMRRRLATVDSDRVRRLWELSGRELWRRDPGFRLHDVAFSPDGDALATASGDFQGAALGVYLWNANTGELRGCLEGHTDAVYAATFSPSGDRLASCSADGTVRLWDPRTAEEVLVLRGHESWVWCTVFSPNGSLLVSGGGNYNGVGVGARVWNAGR